jgi:hypothetical protein
MQLSKNVRQVIGAAIGALIAGAISIAFGIPAADRHERMFNTLAPPAPTETGS